MEAQSSLLAPGVTYNERLPAGMERERGSSGGMETQHCPEFDQWRPTHDTTGDVLRFLTEMRKQSDRLASIEKRGEHMEKIIRSQSQLIVTLQGTMQEVASKLEFRPDMTQRPPQITLPMEPPRVLQPPSSGPQGGVRPRQPPRLPRAPQPAASLTPEPEQANTSGPSNVLRETLKCAHCGHFTTSKRRMENHIRNMHNQSHPSTAVPLTLLVGDSHLSSLNVREVEKGLGRKARLVTPGATRPREDRAYCSTPEWLGARYPQNSLQKMVPELLGERKYTNLILIAPTNDITNLREVQTRQERERLATLSAKNTIKVAEEALKSVEEVLIMEQPARVDDMSSLSELSKKKLREFAQSCPLAGRIRIGSSRPDILNCEERKIEVFGKPSDRRVDGIHMRGKNGKQFLLDTFLEAIKMSGLADRDTRRGGISQPSQGMDRQEQGWTRVERGPRPAPRTEGQRTSWADVSRNQFHTLSN